VAKKLDPLRKRLKSRAKELAQTAPTDDIFGGLGDWDPTPAPKTAIARVIAKLENMRLAKPKPAPKPKPVKKTKPKPPPKPKKGKKVAKVNEVEIRSPFTLKTQWVPLVPELTDLLAEGWEIVDGDVPVNQAYEFLNFIPEGM